MSNLNNIEHQSPDVTHEAMVSRYEAIMAVHKDRGSFISETCHYVSPDEELPFYFTPKSESLLTFRPLRREERRHIQEFKSKYANQHAELLTNTLEKFAELEVLEEVSVELAKGRVLK